jgi:hypothetical protein
MNQCYYALFGCDLFNGCVYVDFLECTYGLHTDVGGSLGMAVGRVGLLSLLYCTLLPAGVDGFTRLSYFYGGVLTLCFLSLRLSLKT